MTPFTRGLEVVSQKVVELLAHADDPISHTLDFASPLGIETLIAKDGVGNTSTVARGVRVHGTDDNLELRVDTSLLLRIGGGQRKSADTLAVETHVLGERLSDSNLMAFFNEYAYGIRVAVGRTGGEALVGHVEEGEKLSLLDNVGDGDPLLLSGVNTGGVVCTGVQEDNRTLRGSLSYP